MGMATWKKADEVDTIDSAWVLVTSIRFAVIPRTMPRGPDDACGTDTGDIPGQGRIEGQRDAVPPPRRTQVLRCQGVIATLERVFLMVSCRRGFVEAEC